MHGWWSDLDHEVFSCLNGGAKSAAEIGRRVGLSEAALTSVLSMLAAEGKIRITRVQIAENGHA